MILLLSIPISALDRDRAINQFHHTAWVAKDGAPSQISALAQTADGYLWIGSALGLFRFDGVKFEQYSPPDQTKLPSYNIYALMATPDNGLWISFRPSGLGFLKDGHLKTFTKPEELPSSQVHCFAGTRDGSVWAGTHNGLALFNGSGWTEIGAEWNFKPDRVRTLFVDKDGNLWVSTENTISFLPAGSNKFVESQTRESTVTKFSQLKDGRLWAAKSYPSDPNETYFEVNQDKRPFDAEVSTEELLFDRDGTLWIANREKGISRLSQIERIYNRPGRIYLPDIETFTQKDGLSSDLLTEILEDREGNIWVGTISGLDRFRHSSIIPVNLPDKFKRMTLVSDQGGKIWVGSTASEFLLKIDDGFEEFDLEKTQISSFFREPDGDIWWGGRGGIFRQTGEKFNYFDKPADLKVDNLWEVIRGEEDDALWVNYGDEGLIYFKDGIWSRRAPPAGLPNRGPSASFHGAGGRIWLGYTENRVFVIDGEQVKGYTSSEGIEIGRAKVIRGRGDRELWVGGELGLAYFKDERFYTVKAEGNQFGAISGIILTANGDVWLNEIHGIVCIPASEIALLKENPDHPVRYRLFDFQDNLPGGPQMNYTVSTAVEGSDGKLWFATDAGLAQINPAALNKNLVPAPVVIKSVTVDDVTRQTFDFLRFPAGTENLTINYTALSLSIPERVQFKYRLDGLENGWRDAGNRREAFYTNLGPGKYRFQVIAANHDGIWNEEGAFLEFEILPRFYQTWWFFVLCFFGFVGLIWIGFLRRVHLVKSRLHLQFEERLAERTRIARELHDSLLQGFISVAMQMSVAVENMPDESPSKSHLNRILELMNQVKAEGRNTLRGLRPASGRNTESLELSFNDFRQNLGTRDEIDFSLKVEGAPRPLRLLIRDEAFQIGREALINAYRHSKAGAIEVLIEYTAKQLKISVRDDGGGIDQKILQGGRDGHWGLSGMRERAKKIGGQLEIQSRLGAGTEVELSIPSRIAFETEGRNRLFKWLNKLFGREIASSGFGRDI